jgi:hypothetical protein
VTGLGAPHEKLIISIPVTALRFTLTDAKQNTPRSPVSTGPMQLTQTEVNMINHTCTSAKRGGRDDYFKNLIIQTSQFVFKYHATKICDEMEIGLHEFYRTEYLCPETKCPQFRQANSETFPQIRPRPLPFMSLPIGYSRPGLESTQTPMQWVPTLFPEG